MDEYVDEEPAPPRADSDKLEAIVARVEGVPCKWRWVHREVPYQADEIVKVARTDDTDLIVIRTHGRRGLMHLLMGSVAERVVRETPCPVLSVRHTKPSTV